jgi:CBS domain-containing protein
MLVRDIMNRNVITASEDINLKDAAKKMYNNKIGSLVIVRKNKLGGIITQTDVIRAISEDREIETTLVADIMNKNVITVEPSKTIEEAVNLMTEHKIKKLPVVDGGKLVGIITASDIIVIEPKLIEGIASLISLKLPGYKGG